MLKTLIIAPNAGFCNRLRTMVSAIYLSEKLKMNIEHLWIGETYRCANINIQEIHNKSFEHFFKENIKRCEYKNMINKINKVYTEWMPTENPFAWYSVQSYGQKLLQIKNFLELQLVNEIMDSSEDFLIETSYINNLNITKKDKNRIYKKYFVPNDYFLDEINKINEIDENTIGISIRKGDFKVYFPETQIDNEIIVKWIDSIDSINSKIIFCSDDKEYEREMREKIKNSIIPNFTSNDREFLDFLLLSKCKIIYGTLKSSFAEEAAYFGDVEYIPITKDFFNFSEKTL